jgi:hypothetical protein
MRERRLAAYVVMNCCNFTDGRVQICLPTPVNETYTNATPWKIVASSANRFTICSKTVGALTEFTEFWLRAIQNPEDLSVSEVLR